MDHLMPFSGNPLDRASNLRDDPEWIARQVVAPESRFLLLSRLEVLTHSSEAPELVWLDASTRPRFENETLPILLGLRDGVAHFALDVSSTADPLAVLGLDGVRFSEPRGLATTLPAGDAGIVAQARARCRSSSSRPPWVKKVIRVLLLGSRPLRT